MYKGKTRIRGHRTYRPLTKNEKKEICRRMTRGGVTQAALAIKYGCHPSAIQRTCEAAGIGRWAKLTPKLEARSVALLRAGKAVYRVAKTTRLQGRVIRELMAKHKIEHRRGGGPKLPAAKRAQIALAVRGREDYIYRLAKKFGVNIRTVRAIARQVAGVEKFVGYQPMTPAETDAQIEAGYQEFLETVFHGNFSKELQMQGIHQDFAKLVERFA
jgi:transposase-like protein